MSLDIEMLLSTLSDTQKLPPVQQWQPSHEGAIDIVIDDEVRWWHEGELFQRAALVKLFSSILRYEQGRYFLVTPVEKLAITVADVPFKIVLMLMVGDIIYLVTNTEDKIALDVSACWQLRDYQGVQIPYVEVRDGLFARVDRNVYYQMVEQAQQKGDHYVLFSGGVEFPLA